MTARQPISPAKLLALSIGPAIALAVSLATAQAQAPPSPATPPAATAPTPAPAAPTTPAPTPNPDAPATTTSPTAPPTASNPGQTPPAAQVQVADPFGEETTLTPKTMVIAKGTATWDAAFETLIDAFKKLTTALDKQGIKSSGNAMIVYTSTDDSGFTFLAELPVDQEPKNPASLGKDVSVGKSPEGKAMKFIHRGSYDNMDNTYEAITNHLDDKKLEAKDTFIEEYITDPLKTAEDKLVINVYVPLK